MVAPKAAVRFTANFESNLASIKSFWREQDASPAYGLLLQQLGKAVIPNLEQHPRLGRRFLARSARSIEVRDRVVKLQQRLGDMDLREYLAGDYLVLYCVDSRLTSVYLLAIRHHKQLSFDFDGFWDANRAADHQ